MAVPDFQSIMLPLMRIANDGQEHSQRDVIEALAQILHLTEDERKELLPSGRQAKFDNRVAWACTYLNKAGLLTRAGRAKFCITERGHDVIGRKPSAINIALLMHYEEFRQFRKPQHVSVQDNHQQPVSEIDNHTQTPEESLELSYQNLRAKVAQELLERVMNCSPRFFEQLVVDLLVAMGYGGSRKDAGQAVGQSGDGGVDGIIKEDRLGLDVVHIQAKRWKDTVGRPTVQAFAGSLEGFRARKGVLITTSQFSQDAKSYVNNIEKKIVLIDGEQLAQYMLDYGIGVSEVATYIVKQIDLDYFDDGQ